MTDIGDSAGDRPTAAELFELMSVLAHDLRTPLTPVRGYAEILRTKPDLGPEKTSQYAAIIVEAASRIERSVEMYSGISALYGGRAEIRPETLRALDVVAERVDMWRGRLPERTFVAADEAGYAAVVADRGWLGKALDVLIDRAVRTWPAPAVISFGAHAARDRETTRFAARAVDVPDVAEPPRDRLAHAFVVAVADVCGYAMHGAFAIDVPTATHG
jgi:K+-sensing histidine kinase KdpD